jgi:hypothetical protein
MVVSTKRASEKHVAKNGMRRIGSRTGRMRAALFCVRYAELRQSVGQPHRRRAFDRSCPRPSRAALYEMGAAHTPMAKVAPASCGRLGDLQPIAQRANVLSCFWGSCLPGNRGALPNVAEHGAPPLRTAHRAHAGGAIE